MDLILDIDASPFVGLGKPEALRGNMSGCWSRRIDQVHRLIYRCENDLVEIISCYGHYGEK